MTEREKMMRLVADHGIHIKILGAFLGGFLAFILAYTSMVLLPTRVIEDSSASDYYSLTQPLTMDEKIYSNCTSGTGINMVASATRTSTRQLGINSYVELIQLKEIDGRLLEVMTGVRIDFPFRVIDADVISIEAKYNMPCGYTPGRYKWKGGIVFDIKGIAKEYPFETESFLVIDAEKKEIVDEGIK